MDTINLALLERLCTTLVSAAHTVFGDDLRGAILKGSSLSTDFIPFYSDIDFHFFIAAARLPAQRIPRVADALAFQTAIGPLRPIEFQAHSFQIYFLIWEHGYPTEWATPWPGTYRLLYGTLPPDFTAVRAQDYLERARAHMGWFLTWADEFTGRLACAADDDLPDLVRQLGAILKPMIYVAGTLATGEPERVWRLPLAEAVALSAPELAPDGALSAFFAGVRDWPPTPALARALIGTAYRTFDQARTWFARQPATFAAPAETPTAADTPANWSW